MFIKGDNEQSSGNYALGIKDEKTDSRTKLIKSNQMVHRLWAGLNFDHRIGL